jgi:hypothetical protein
MDAAFQPVRKCGRWWSSRRRVCNVSRTPAQRQWPVHPDFQVRAASCSSQSGEMVELTATKTKNHNNTPDSSCAINVDEHDDFLRQDTVSQVVVEEDPAD